MVEELIEQLISMADDMDSAMEMIKTVDFKNDLRNQLEYDKLRAKIETDFSQLAVFFVKMPEIQNRFEELRNIYKNTFLFKKEE